MQSVNQAANYEVCQPLDVSQFVANYDSYIEATSPEEAKDTSPTGGPSKICIVVFQID